MKKIIEYSMIFEIYLACAITCVAMLGRSRWTSLLIAVNYLTVLFLFCLTLFHKRKVRGDLFVPLLLLIVLSFFSVFISRTEISFDYLKKWIMFSCTVMIYYCAAVMDVTSGIITAMFRGSLVVSAIFIGMYCTGNHHSIADAITLNLGNSNFTGVCILCTALCLFPFFQKQRKLGIKLLLGGILVFLLYLLWLTKARACWLAASVYLMLILLWRGGYKKWMTLFFLLFPLLFALIYMPLSANSNVLVFFSFLIDKGKTLTSRVDIWNYAFYIIKSNPFFGNYYLVTQGTGLGQLHNLNLDIMAAFGIPVFVCMLVYLQNLIHKIGREVTNRQQMVSIFAYYALMISGTFEAALFGGSQGMYVLSAGILMLARYREEKAAER